MTLKLRCLPGNVLELTVKDRGRGIPDVEKARQPMYTTGGEERAGLGFAVMQSFCDSVRVTSKVGKGVSVTLCKHFETRS